MQISGITPHNDSDDLRKRKEQKLIFKRGTLAPNGIIERFSFIWSLLVLTYGLSSICISLPI